MIPPRLRRGLREFLITTMLSCVGFVFPPIQISAESTKSDIVLGQIFDQSRAELVLIARVQRAYFDRINADGGVHGHLLHVVTLDDRGPPEGIANSPNEPIESHNMLALLGKPKVRAGLNSIPQLFVRDRIGTAPINNNAALASFYPSYELEGALIAKHILKRTLFPRVAVLSGDDVASAQWVSGLSEGLNAGSDIPLAAKVVPAAVSEATLDASMREIRASGANVLVIAASLRLTLHALHIAHEINWLPQRLITSEVANALREQPETVRAEATHTESVRYLKDGYDPSWSTLGFLHFALYPRWDNDRDVQVYNSFIKRYVPDAEPKSEPTEFGYSTARLVVQVLNQCQDILTRENVSRQLMRLALTREPLLSPGIRLYTYPGRNKPITQGQFIRFNGTAWTEFDDVLDVGD